MIANHAFEWLMKQVERSRKVSSVSCAYASAIHMSTPGHMYLIAIQLILNEYAKRLLVLRIFNELNNEFHNMTKPSNVPNPHLKLLNLAWA